MCLYGATTANHSEIIISNQSGLFLWNAIPEQVICFISEVLDMEKWLSGDNVSPSFS